MIIRKHVKIGKRGVIVIPKEIREKGKLSPHQTVKMTYLDGQIVIRTSPFISISASKFEGSPEDAILRILSRIKLSNEDWEEIKRDRHREDCRTFENL